MSNQSNEFQEYVCVKTVSAKPMTRRQYNELRGWTLPANENPDDVGMLTENTHAPANTEHFKGFIQWEPMEAFLMTHALAENLTFGLAMQVCKQGAKIRRADWKEPDMWIVLVPGNGRRMEDADGTQYPFHDSIQLKTWDGTLMAWTPSVNDILREDWEVVE